MTTTARELTQGSTFTIDGDTFTYLSGATTTVNGGEYRVIGVIERPEPFLFEADRELDVPDAAEQPEADPAGS